jgi:hypothetical protein
MRKFAAILAAFPLLTACADDADVAKKNLSKAADNFEIVRRVVMYNAIRGEIIMTSEGKCSVSPGELRTSVICKVGPDQYIRNFYGNSDNTVYFVEQMDPVPVNVYHYRRTFKPQSVLPDIDFRGSAKAAVKAVTPDSKD